jgi:acyl dehydratase
MPIDPERLLARDFAPLEAAYGTRDTIFYALSLGIGSDPVDPGELRFIYEDALVAMPTMVNILGYPGFWAKEADTGIDWRRLVHAEQAIVLHRPLAPTGRVVARTRITGLWDKGADRGAFLQQTRDVTDAETGNPIATVTQLSLLRGDGGRGGSDGAPPAPHVIPDRPADAVCDLPTLPQAALLYRLNGDFNPLHADPVVARAAGFERPILHGLCTMGIAAFAALKTMLDFDASRIAGMRVRFTAPVLPGDVIRTEVWRDGGVLSLRASVPARGVTVLDRSRIDLF